jgi:phosphomannomutase
LVSPAGEARLLVTVPPGEDRVMSEWSAAARAWLAADPDPDTRAELEALLGAGDDAGLADRFAGRLQFGTAGLRGAIGAGPLRMNRVIVRRAAWGVGKWLLETGRALDGVVIGRDARHKSDVFAFDSAYVLAALGIRCELLPGPLPTPVLAYATRRQKAAAGIMVTASHNPAADNGYKVYLGDGAQIVPPVDVDISAWIDRAPEQPDLAAETSPLVVHLERDVVDDYVAAAAGVLFESGRRLVRIAYTPLHGVGKDVALAAFTAAGFSAPAVVAEQADPDPEFPTVHFPNPEEPGAMDLVTALAVSTGADVALANDPDADRLAVAIPTRDGGWRRLGGDEVGWLLGDYVVAHTSGSDRLIATTVVSSTLLSQLAASAGIDYAETLTGFKWIARAAADRPGTRFVFGYEQALGYLIGDTITRDKDGITAALMMAELVACSLAEGVTIEDRLDDLARRFGRHRLADSSVRMEPKDALVFMDAMRSSPPETVGGMRVVGVVDRRDGNLLVVKLEGGTRVLVRPSGTEPKVKFYAETTSDDVDPAALLAAFANSISN